LQDFARPLNPNWGMLTCTHSYYNWS
jgi:hypothetical protein